jgi:hypothetical protein
MIAIDGLVSAKLARPPWPSRTFSTTGADGGDYRRRVGFGPSEAAVVVRVPSSWMALHKRPVRKAKWSSARGAALVTAYGVLAAVQLPKLTDSTQFQTVIREIPRSAAFDAVCHTK